MMAIPVCSDAQQVLIKAVVDTIVSRTNPERIICYGVRAETRKRWSCFSRDEKEQSFITLDLLVITHQTDKRDRDHVANLIESLGGEGVRLIAVAHSVDALKTGLEQRNTFFISACGNGMLLYGSEEQLAEFNHASPNEVCCKSARLERAQSFYRASCDCTTDGNFETAMFLLHQAVELSCAELLNCRLGYKATTHSVKKLFALSENITPLVTELFSESNEDESKLLNQLHRAYVDVRYKENYSIEPDDVFTLSDRVSELLHVIENLCKASDEPTGEAEKEPSDFISIPKFDSLDVAVPSNIILQRGKKPAIQIETEQDGESFLRYEVKDGRLYLFVKAGSETKVPDAVINVTYVSLTGVVVDHSGTITCAEIIESETLGIIQNGKGFVELSVRVGSLDATVTKSGGLRLFGTANHAKVLNTGPGEFDGTDLEVSEAKVTICDSGNITICVEDELQVHLLGDGKLHIKGEPRLKKISMSR